MLFQPILTLIFKDPCKRYFFVLISLNLGNVEKYEIKIYFFSYLLLLLLFFHFYLFIFFFIIIIIIFFFWPFPHIISKLCLMVEFY